MRKDLRWIFWMEAVLASVATLLGALTSVQPDWIERVFALDLDNHSGAVEWKLVVSFFLAAFFLSTIACRSWLNAPMRPAKNPRISDRLQ